MLKHKIIVSVTFLGVILNISIAQASTFLKNESCQVHFDSSSKAYLFDCAQKVSRYVISPEDNVAKTYQQMKELYLQDSKNKQADTAKLQEMVLTNLESDLRFKYPGDDELIGEVISKLESINDGLISPVECVEDHTSSKLAVTSFVDLNLEGSFQNSLVREFADAKMSEEGFLNLGKLEEVSINLRTDNDNFLHGGIKLIGEVPKDVWWNGDDRGYTFGQSMELKFDFEDGSIRGKQYTHGYSSLASIIKEVEVCSDGECKKVPTVVKRDEFNKRYQTFLTIDGLELELRRNHINGDIYVKMAGSVESQNVYGC